jgi:guanylate kinase
MKKETRANWKGILIVLSAPSGAGKTSLCKAAMERLADLTHSVSYTTRSPRPGEVHGRDYSFVEEETFERMIEEGEFVEWARVHGNLYGTSRSVLQEIQRQGSDVILDIDAQGARTLMARKELEAVFVFVVTPTFAELERRLRQRGADSEEEIQRRLNKAREEIAEFESYDYLLVNDDFEQALKELIAILHAEQCSVGQVDHQWIKKEFIEK